MEPYWLVNRKPGFPALRRDMRTDVAVIGAGITGTSVCYWLSDKCKVILLEEDIIASKASGRNAGFLLTGTADYYNKAIRLYGRDKARAAWKITQENHDLLEEHIFSEETCDHKRSGGYLVAASDKEMEDIAESVNLLKEDGFSYTLISAAGINETLSSRGFHGAAFSERDGEVNPVKLVEALSVRAKGSGTQIFERTEAKGISAGKDGFIIKTAHALIHSDYVVLATNAYAPILYPYFRDTITPARAQMLATNPLRKRFTGAFYANYGREYWRQAPDGRVLAGGFRRLDLSNRKSYKMVTTQNVQKNLEKLLAQMSLQFTVEHRWAGIMGFSKDYLPIIGPLPGNDKFLVALGYTGHGLGFGFYAGKTIAERILQGNQGNLELFSPSRFG